MNIDNVNKKSLSFESAYRFRSLPAGFQRKLERIVNPKSSQIFNNVGAQGDVVIVNHRTYDERIANFISSNMLRFEYFPGIKLGANLDMKGLQYLVSRDLRKHHYIDNIPALKLQLLASSANLKSQVENADTYFTTLRLNVEKPRFGVSRNGLLKVRDDVKERTIYFSRNYDGNIYVFVKPDSVNKPSGRYLLGYNGKRFIKSYESPKELKVFNNFSCIVPD